MKPTRKNLCSIKLMKNGKLVTFNLDGNPFHKGIGKIINFQKGDRVIKVELLGPCKEFNVGQRILIDDTEITGELNPGALGICFGELGQNLTKL